MVKRRRWKSKLQVRGVIMKKVVKFGGSSLANAEQFQKVGDIIRSDESRRYVVPSAPGKRFDEDIKVTDMLYACYEAAENDKPCQELLKGIEARYDEIIKGLGLELSLKEDLNHCRNFKRSGQGLRGVQRGISERNHNGCLSEIYFIDAG